MAQQVYAGQRITAALLNAIQPLSASPVEHAEYRAPSNDHPVQRRHAVPEPGRERDLLDRHGPVLLGQPFPGGPQLPVHPAVGRVRERADRRDNVSGPSWVGASANNWSSATSAACNGAGSIQALRMHGTLVTVSAGTLQLQWAQNTSSSTKTQMESARRLTA